MGATDETHQTTVLFLIDVFLGKEKTRFQSSPVSLGTGAALFLICVGAKAGLARFFPSL